MSLSSSEQKRADILDWLRNCLDSYHSHVNQTTPPKPISNSDPWAMYYTIDSLDTLALVLDIEKKYNIEITDEDAKNLFSFDSAVDYLLKRGC